MVLKKCSDSQSVVSYNNSGENVQALVFYLTQSATDVEDSGLRHRRLELPRATPLNVKCYMPTQHHRHWLRIVQMNKGSLMSE